MSKKNSSSQNKELGLKFQTLPTFAQQLISYIHYKTGAAAELILIVLLGVMAFSCQDKFDVQLKNGRTFTSLYLLLLARSGSRKSTVFKALMETIHQMEKELKNSFLEKEKLYELKKVSWDTELKELKKQFSKAVRQKVDVAETREALEECQKSGPVAPVRKYLTKNDSTSEGLKKTLALGSPSLMLGSDEAGGVFDSSLFREISVLNSLWGEGRISDSRASRDSYDVDDVRLTILLLLQPAIFNDFLGKQGKKLKNSGFLARLLLIDLEQIPELCDIPDICSWSDEPGLDGFFSILVKHLQDGIQRRENNEERICITLSEEAKALWETQNKRIRELMQLGGDLHHYDDFGSRIMEQATRIAAVMQIFITPDSPIITRDTFLSAAKISEWCITHLILKVDSTRRPSEKEKLLFWLEEHVISNKSYDFRRHTIRRDGPNSLRSIESLMSVLKELEKDGKVQLFKEDGVDYVKYIGSEVHPFDIAKASKIPLISSGSIAFNKLLKNE
ncbi:YfjI family protein [Citrobacter portucalensis]|uniref:YfjI family protein n=1 Tax=Citrobacter portucalensis TaxID=1639133 RepID=UPI00242AB28B|nr:YfjI family protein [Citrobacter portucalensis]WFZ25695.1 YfjI family protein [Citrobacter portucalensis]